jgi:hypothetical protein
MSGINDWHESGKLELDSVVALELPGVEHRADVGLGGHAATVKYVRQHVDRDVARLDLVNQRVELGGRPALPVGPQPVCSVGMEAALEWRQLRRDARHFTGGLPGLQDVVVQHVDKGILVSREICVPEDVGVVVVGQVNPLLAKRLFGSGARPHNDDGGEQGSPNSPRGVQVHWVLSKGDNCWLGSVDLCKCNWRLPDGSTRPDECPCAGRIDLDPHTVLSRVTWRVPIRSRPNPRRSHAAAAPCPPPAMPRR